MARLVAGSRSYSLSTQIGHVVSLGGVAHQPRVRKCFIEAIVCALTAGLHLFVRGA